ncbi:hypothetical protein [Paraburkholderia elongata]|uniref:N-acetyltransferase domain-containing protein n=1 Tax=Paraburkholderia elongata TaxID=2675747 RepID=A0A972NL10_9BURK|nr:hypothetical protein [Paraburkholderia elongata]NPT54218.1 hypothetical protein [Paraburkholderia elongata]
MKIIDFLRTLSWRRKIRGLPAISVRTTTSDPGSPTLPNPVWETAIFSIAGEKVGEATYGLSPRSDHLYIYRLEVSEPVRRKGYGLAFLVLLHSTYRVPLTPIVESHCAEQFWDTARELRPVGLEVTPGRSRADVLEELARWRHLRAGINGSLPGPPTTD